LAKKLNVATQDQLEQPDPQELEVLQELSERPDLSDLKDSLEPQD